MKKKIDRFVKAFRSYSRSHAGLPDTSNISDSDTRAIFQHVSPLGTSVPASLEVRAIIESDFANKICLHNGWAMHVWSDEMLHSAFGSLDAAETHFVKLGCKVNKYFQSSANGGMIWGILEPLAELKA